MKDRRSSDLLNKLIDTGDRGWTRQSAFSHRRSCFSQCHDGTGNDTRQFASKRSTEVPMAWSVPLMKHKRRVETQVFSRSAVTKGNVVTA